MKKQERVVLAKHEVGDKTVLLVEQGNQFKIEKGGVESGRKVAQQFHPTNLETRDAAVDAYNAECRGLTNKIKGKRADGSPESFVWRKIKFEAANRFCYVGHIILPNVLIKIKVFDEKFRGGGSNREDRFHAECAAEIHGRPQGALYSDGVTKEKALTALLTEIRRMAKVHLRNTEDTVMLDSIITDNTAGIRHGGMKTEGLKPKVRRKK